MWRGSWRSVGSLLLRPRHKPPARKPETLPLVARGITERVVALGGQSPLSAFRVLTALSVGPEQFCSLLKLIPAYGVEGYRVYGQAGPLGTCRGAAWLRQLGSMPWRESWAAWEVSVPLGALTAAKNQQGALSTSPFGGGLVKFCGYASCFCARVWTRMLCVWWTQRTFVRAA